MSFGKADAKFPDHHASGLPPSPSRENPGQVFPDSDPNSKAAPAASVPGTGAPRTPAAQGSPGPHVPALDESLARLDHALADVVSQMQSQDVGGEDALLRKLEGWRDELTQILRGQRRLHVGSGRSAEDIPREREGGLFTD